MNGIKNFSGSYLAESPEVFAKAHRDWKSKLRIAAGKLFPWTNLSAATPSDPVNEKREALANLATTTAADRSTVSTLTDTIAQLSSKLASI